MPGWFPQTARKKQIKTAVEKRRAKGERVKEGRERSERHGRKEERGEKYPPVRPFI